MNPVIYIVADDISVRRALKRLIRSVGVRPLAKKTYEAVEYLEKGKKACRIEPYLLQFPIAPQAAKKAF